MKTLNKERKIWLQKWQDIMKPQANGIECPKCKCEFWDADPAIILSIPPQKAVYCPTCGYKENIDVEEEI